MGKLKSNEKAAYRAEQLDKQGGVCPLCENEIPEGQDTLDHCHDTGHVRKVLCRNCNSIEGRVKHWASRVQCDAQQWLNNLMWYWNQDYTNNPVYPSHQTEIEKEISRLRKVMKKRKRAKTKAKYQAQINRLLKQVKRSR